MRVEIHEAAAEEAADVVRWYRSRDNRAAERLAELFVAAMTQIARRPQSFSRLEGVPTEWNVRRARLHRFPLVVIFQLREDEAFVIAVAHASRDPGYWTSRLTHPNP